MHRSREHVSRLLCSMMGPLFASYASQGLVAAAGSQGLMLETASDRLMQPGMPHHNCPDKVSIFTYGANPCAFSLSSCMLTGWLAGALSQASLLAWRMKSRRTL